MYVHCTTRSIALQRELEHFWGAKRQRCDFFLLGESEKRN